MSQMTITHNRTEMSDLNIKLIFEQQKIERQTAMNEQLDSQMNELLNELKVNDAYMYLLTYLHSC